MASSTLDLLHLLDQPWQNIEGRIVMKSSIGPRIRYTKKSSGLITLISDGNDWLSLPYYGDIAGEALAAVADK